MWKDNFKRYNPRKEGYGNPQQWVNHFKRRFNFKEFKNQKINPFKFVDEAYSNCTNLNEIKKIFKKLAVENHPDKFPNNFKQQNDIMAYIVQQYYRYKIIYGK